LNVYVKHIACSIKFINYNDIVSRLINLITPLRNTFTQHARQKSDELAKSKPEPR